MRFGYWMPVFGGWLRNVHDEGMPVAWPYIRDLATESERHGFELALIAELNLNDIKGHRAPSLGCWALAPAVAARTEKLELMLAVRPNYHSPSLTAKALSTLDTIAPGRLSLNVVSSPEAFASYQDFLAGSQLESRVSPEEYSVSNRGLRTGLIGTPERITDGLRAYEQAGVDLVLLQMSPQRAEMARFGRDVISRYLGRDTRKSDGRDSDGRDSDGRDSDGRDSDGRDGG
jgi:alkanesulfonate monooxygenase SsuD/methylene tetrahydromethanopterin reductase-like flavin-dependent oxidoreductase (luciferase family)